MDFFLPKGRYVNSTEITKQFVFIVYERKFRQLENFKSVSTSSTMSDVCPQFANHTKHFLSKLAVNVEPVGRKIIFWEMSEPKSSENRKNQCKNAV